MNVPTLWSNNYPNGALIQSVSPRLEGQLLPGGMHELSRGRVVSKQVERGGVASGWS